MRNRVIRGLVWLLVGGGAVAFLAFVLPTVLLLAGLMLGPKCISSGCFPDQVCPPDEPEPRPRTIKPAPPGGVRQLSLGDAQSCALGHDGLVRCWGHTAALAGRETPPPQTVDVDLKKYGATPHVVPAPANVTQIAQHRLASCTVDAEHRLRCSRVVGHGADLQAVYEPWLELPDVRQVLVGAEFACALRLDGSAWCWGANRFEQLGYTTKGDASDVPALTRAHVQRLALGLEHACALIGEPERTHLECWGRNSEGQQGGFGAGPSKAARSKAPVDDATFRELAAGASHTCALTSAGAVWCWGGNGAGQAGATSGDGHVQGLPNDIVQLAADADTTCARSDAGDIYCWGSFGAYDYANAGAPPALPRKLRAAAPAKDLAVGRNYACVILTDDRVACGGLDANRQLGAILPSYERSPGWHCTNKAWFEAGETRDLEAVAW